MSFQDLEAGTRSPAPNRFTGGRQQRPSSRGDPSQEVAAGIFRISTAVNSFFRLVNSIGTPKDTLELRDKLSVAILNHTLLLFVKSLLIRVLVLLIDFGRFHFNF